ncbi:hypothetical protein OHB36_08890 [Streptomyces sp. NBC_00320]|uniref:hypothetical protein n=1 Tax=Streptomyces sp. NBC_00320 TaxID=2975711 RepID=UPI00225735B4|nr:hypothetical protein [Streptomyces sp. NBC_00320]MCX5146893.1 hypothetical protein [Streptomyces sp. NBC_00320]
MSPGRAPAAAAGAAPVAPSGAAPGTGDGWSAGAAQALGAVLGAGALLLPAALAPQPGPWTGVAVAGVLAGWCLLVAAAGGTADAGPVAFVRDRLGPGPARAATALYFGGFATGQAGVALGAAGFALGDSGWRAYAAAAGVLCSAAASAWFAPRGLSPAGRRLRPAAVLALAVAWRVLGGPLPGPGAEDRAGWAALLVAVPLLFGWVGLEGAVPAAARRRTLGGTLLGIALAAALYCVLLGPPPAVSAPPPAAAAVGATLGIGSAALCWTYCRTNLQATAARWTELTGRTRRGGVVAAALIALGVLVLGGAARWGLPALLIGPGAATAALYTLIAVAAVRRPRPRPRPQEPTDHDHADPGHSERAAHVLEGAARPAG